MQYKIEIDRANLCIIYYDPIDLSYVKSITFKTLKELEAFIVRK